MALNPKLKSSLVFLAKLLVTLVPAYFVYRNIVSAPDWDIGDLYELFSTKSVLPFVLALLCLAVSNFTACLQWKLLLQVDYSNVIGMNLVNFAFTNEVALAEVMTQMYALYLEAKRHKDENAFIAMVLIEQYMPLLEQNYYVSVYLMWYIEFLLQGEVDPRVFTKIVGIDKELFQLLVVQDDPEAVEILKYKLIPSICRCYEAKKGLVEVTLKAVWEEQQTDGLESLERYYKYEQEEHFFRKHWNSSFTVKLGKRDEKTVDVIQLTELDTIDDMLRYDMLQLLTKGN